MWRTSSISDGSECVDVAVGEREVLVRHSCEHQGSVLRFSRGEWAAFLAGVRLGEFDEPVRR